MLKSITKQINYTAEDYYEALKLMFQRSKYGKYVVKLAGVLLVFFALTSFVSDTKYFSIDGTVFVAAMVVSIVSNIVYLVVGFFLFTWEWVGLRIISRRRYKALLKDTAESEITVGEKFFSRKTKISEGKFLWSGIKYYFFGSKTLLLFPNPAQFILLPRRFFTEGEWLEISDFVRATVIGKK